MISAIILMKVARGRVTEIGEALAALSGVAEVFSIAGRYDLVVIIRVAKDEDMAALVTEAISSLPDITYTETMTAFKVYSKHDLESMFSLGISWFSNQLM